MLKRLAVLLAVLLAAWLVAATLLFVVPHGDKPMHADAVFVLSGSETRLPVGVRLVKEGYAPLLVISRTTPRPTQLEQLACGQGLGIRVLCVRAAPYSTVGEAETIARLAAQRHWIRLDVVTSQYHVLRARIILRRCYRGGLRVVGAPNVLSLLPWNAAMESVKLVYHELVHRGC
jgi:uncharacterized SAM-binding protein YcdF (DUF218 family)